MDRLEPGCELIGENRADHSSKHPLGPWIASTRSVRPLRCRIRALFVLFAASFVLGAAGWLEPDPSGQGTHRQLGLAPCSLPMLTGLPCPSCGMTTAFAFAVRGQFASAFWAQPAGVVLVILVMAAWLMSCYVIVTGRTWRLNWYRVNPNRVAFGAVGVILAAWAFKIVQAVTTQGLP